MLPLVFSYPKACLTPLHALAQGPKGQAITQANSPYNHCPHSYLTQAQA